MLNYPPEQWKRWGIEDPYHQMFVLHWTELFDPDTPDTWQFRTCNVKTILREVIEAAPLVEQFDAYRGVIRALLDEAFTTVKRDAVLAHAYPFVAEYLEPWRTADISKDGAVEVARLAVVILGHLNAYWDAAVSLIIELLHKADGKQKKRLYDVTINLAVEAIARGHSPRYVRQAFIDAVLIEGPTGFVERVQGLFDSFAKGQARFTCSFLVSGVRRQDTEALPPDVQWADKPDKVPAGPPEEFFQRLTQTGFYLKTDVEAADPEAARHIAGQRLGHVFAGLNLFKVDGKVALRDTGVLVEDGKGKAHLIEAQRLGSKYLGDYESRLTKAEMLFRVQGRLGPPDNAHLAAALQYHRLAMLATGDEARFVNLWVALEALCQGRQGSIIERVCARVAPCVSVDNISKTMINLALYVRQLWEGPEAGAFATLFPGSKKDYLSPDELLALLLKPEDGPEIKELCRLCGKHTLILNRLFRTKTMTFAGPESVAVNLEYTRRNVDWQLKRIYRVRNLIVHSGQGAAMLPQLTQHLHSYLVKTIHSVLVELDAHPEWTIRDALEHRRRLFERVVATLKKKRTPEEPAPVSIRSLMHPDNFLRPQVPPFAWPDPIKPTLPEAVQASPVAPPPAGG